MASCPKCHANLSEGFNFCTKCGAVLSPTSTPATPKPKDSLQATRTAFTCRFCRNPLPPDGEFCETCGAPLEEAAPPDFIKPKPKPTPPPPENVSTGPAPVSSIPKAKQKASGQTSPEPKKKERPRPRAGSGAQPGSLHRILPRPGGKLPHLSVVLPPLLLNPRPRAHPENRQNG